jgi:hypothetical protein
MHRDVWDNPPEFRQKQNVLVGLVRKSKSLATRLSCSHPIPKNTYLDLAASTLPCWTAFTAPDRREDAPKELSVPVKAGRRGDFNRRRRAYRSEKDYLKITPQRKRSGFSAKYGDVWENLRRCESTPDTR